MRSAANADADAASPAAGVAAEFSQSEKAADAASIRRRAAGRAALRAAPLRCRFWRRGPPAEQLGREPRRCGAASAALAQSRTTITIMCWIAGGSTNRNSFKNIGCRLPAEPTRSTAAPRHLLGRHQGAPNIAKGCRLFVVLHPHGHSRLRACRTRPSSALLAGRFRKCSPCRQLSQKFLRFHFLPSIIHESGWPRPAVGGAPLGHSPHPRLDQAMPSRDIFSGG